ncbi:carbohydrate ABC transporter permease [Roseomonas haemaphysalidis]|uniref:Carbohydrate ABC transporter permease n=1 Tax=Roseomonas haemaphysalidis TaxID=2768162 RepID=A0ABS3KLW0_9PROT|nr:carbohydrate ABC transporter permease [Roseomonas haemaphysalidis]MBO1078439.1 carbohydrate ABC transporter permease [Roseomonas haemaphysalidis]
MTGSKRNGWVYIPVAVLVAVTVLPFLWVVVSSFKTLEELYSLPLHLLPQHATLANYVNVLYQSNIPRYFLNSTIVSLGSTAIGLVFAIPAAYGLARFRFKGNGLLQSFILICHLLPTAALIIPLYVMFGYLRLLNSYVGLILAYLILTLPLSIWMLTGYFRSIPAELEEAAVIDGASRLTVLLRIMLPLSLPGVVVIVLYAFVATWNEFIFALSFASDPSVKTLPIGVAEFTTSTDTDWGAIMAASVIMTLPVAFVFFALQRLFVGGLLAGAVKG